MNPKLIFDEGTESHIGFALNRHKRLRALKDITKAYNLNDAFVMGDDTQVLIMCSGNTPVSDKIIITGEDYPLYTLTDANINIIYNGETAGYATLRKLKNSGNVKDTRLFNVEILELYPGEYYRMNSIAFAYKSAFGIRTYDSNEFGLKSGRDPKTNLLVNLDHIQKANTRVLFYNFDSMGGSTANSNSFIYTPYYRATYEFYNTNKDNEWNQYLPMTVYNKFYGSYYNVLLQQYDAQIGSSQYDTVYFKETDSVHYARVFTWYDNESSDTPFHKKFYPMIEEYEISKDGIVKTIEAEKIQSSVDVAGTDPYLVIGLNDGGLICVLRRGAPKFLEDTSPYEKESRVIGLYRKAKNGSFTPIDVSFLEGSFVVNPNEYRKDIRAVYLNFKKTNNAAINSLILGYPDGYVDNYLFEKDRPKDYVYPEYKQPYLNYIDRTDIKLYRYEVWRSTDNGYTFSKNSGFNVDVGFTHAGRIDGDEDFFGWLFMNAKSDTTFKDRVDPAYTGHNMFYRFVYTKDGGVTFEQKDIPKEYYAPGAVMIKKETYDENGVLVKFPVFAVIKIVNKNEYEIYKTSDLFSTFKKISKKAYSNAKGYFDKPYRDNGQNRTDLQLHYNGKL